MPTPPVIDVDALLEPIPGDDPSGSPVPFVLRERLDLARKEVDPNAFSRNDPMRPAEAKPADWSGIVAMTTEALVGTSKDLMLVARLVEALTKLYGFGGLRDGLHLLRRLIEEAWDRIRPIIEEPDDVEARAAAIHWLDDADRGARFPSAVRTAAILQSAAGPINWVTWSQMRVEEPDVTVEDFEKAVKFAPREACQDVADDLDAIQAELAAILAAAADRMGSATPSLSQVRHAVQDCWTLAHQVLERKGPAPAAPAAPAGADPAADPAPEGDQAGDAGVAAGGPGGRRGPITNRAQAYERLIEVADALGVLEPHSPIPHVIRRAIDLGQLSFPELMRELIADAAVLDSMGRNLGIKELRAEE